MKMTDAQVMAALRSDTPLNRARLAFSSASATISQESMQRRPAGPIEIRRMEFEAVIAIAKALGIEIAETPTPESSAPKDITGLVPAIGDQHG